MFLICLLVKLLIQFFQAEERIIQYQVFDWYSRAIQTVLLNSSPSLSDRVFPNSYDRFDFLLKDSTDYKNVGIEQFRFYQNTSSKITETHVSKLDSNVWFERYYVFDEFDNLALACAPEAIKELRAIFR